MTSVQHHGFVFEDWVKNVLSVEDLAYNYTQKWDIPGETPVSVKCMGLTNALEFGSAVRIWEIHETFTLVVGRWEQVGSKKLIRSIDEIDITPKILQRMVGSITLKELRAFDEKIKSFPAGKDGQEKGVEFAKKWISDRRKSFGLLTITRKIDSRNQRRIQCNLNYKNYVELFGSPSKKIKFRGQIFTQEINHAPRMFRDKQNDSNLY